MTDKDNGTKFIEEKLNSIIEQIKKGDGKRSNQDTIYAAGYFAHCKKLLQMFEGQISLDKESLEKNQTDQIIAAKITWLLGLKDILEKEGLASTTPKVDRYSFFLGKHGAMEEFKETFKDTLNKRFDLLEAKLLLDDELKKELIERLSKKEGFEDIIKLAAEKLNETKEISECC